LHNGKLVEWERQTKRFLTMPTSVDAASLHNDYIQSILIDKAQNCWVATMGGFKQFDLRRRMFIHTWLPEPKANSAISATICEGIEELNDSVLIITSQMGGINFFNKNTHRFRALTTADGLPAATTHAIKKGPRGELWFTTNFGLYRFMPFNKPLQFQNSGAVVSSPFSATRLYALKNSMWATYSTSEVIFYSPATIQQSTSEKSKTEITALSVFGNSLPVDSVLSLPNGLTL
jgi:ligand-binding sensor domain-containing protein